MIAQLLLGHFIADYPAQTNWIFARKLAGWHGLLMHGGIVLVAQASATFPNTLRLLPILLGMAAVHTVQDFLKIRYGDRLFRGNPAIPYFLDQFLHILLIFFASREMVRRVGEQPAAVQWTALAAATLVVVTWAYHITWRVIDAGQHPYAMDWQWPGVVERGLAFTGGLLAAWWLLPVAVVSRFGMARVRGLTPGQAWRERFLLLDLALGVGLATVLGFLVRRYGLL